MSRKKIVLSGINLIDGGALSVYHDFLDELVNYGYTEKYEITAFVGNAVLFEKYANNVKIIELPKSKQSWLYRIYYEYFYFKKVSKEIDSDIWISMHDMTPNVVAKKQYVYCHNPSPFNKMKLSEAKYGIKYYLFSKFYRYLYAINIKKNSGVIVQQEWMRKEFKKMFDIKNVIVARPSMPDVPDFGICSKSNENIFVFPSYPRYYKNFQVACKAADLLIKQHINNFKLYITIDGKENKYSSELVQEFRDNPNICFCGLLSRDELYSLYEKSSCLLFMSKVETWGMPIVEFKTTCKPIIVSDLPYCYETVGDYSHVAFVNPDDANELAKKMCEIITSGTISGENKLGGYEAPFASNWKELIDIIF